MRIALWQISETLVDLNRRRELPTEPVGATETRLEQEETQSPAPEPFRKTTRQEDLEARKRKLAEKKAARQKQPAPALEPTPSAGKPLRRLRLPPVFLKLQFWLTVIGVLLVILGVIFLYNYSVDQGWINSPMKVAFGVALGMLLMVPGVIVHKRLRFFSQMLMAGGIITLYLSGYAAFQVYELIPFSVAMVWMGAVTLLSFALSVQQNEQTLAAVATLGGLITPLMLHQGISSKTDVVIYISAVLLGAAAIFLVKGWRLLLWISFAGGWISLLYLNNLHVLNTDQVDRDKVGMQCGVAFVLAAFWIVPLLREVLSVRNPSRWPRSAKVTQGQYDMTGWILDRQVFWLSISNPFIALLFTRAIWHLDNQDWGWVVLGLASMFGLSYAFLRGYKELRELAYVQALIDLALLTMAIGLLLRGDSRFIALTAETLALHLVAWKLKDRIILYVAHGFSLAIGLLLAQQLFENRVAGTAIFNSQALSELAFIVMIAGVSSLVSQKEIRGLYQLLSYLALMGWFLREFSDLSNGQGYVTVAWGVCALLLLAAGIARGDSNWRLAALIALFVVVAKLLLVDLATVKAIWRVLLLVGFGIVFLFLSYFFQSLWRPAHKPKAGAIT